MFYLHLLNHCYCVVILSVLREKKLHGQRENYVLLTGDAENIQ